MTPHQLRFLRFAALTAAITVSTAGCSRFVEPPGPPTASTSFAENVNLDSTVSPVAVRHLAFEISPPDPNIQVTFTVKAYRFIDENRVDFPEDVTISVRPDEATIEPYSGSPGQAFPGALFSFTDLCSRGCKSGATVIIRGTSAAHPIDEIRLEANLSASSASGTQAPLNTTMSIMDDGPLPFDGLPVGTAASVESTLVLSPASPAAHVDLVLSVESGLLDDPLTYPLVGAMTIRAKGIGADHDRLWSVLGHGIGSLTVDGKKLGMAPEGGIYEIDWLRLCKPMAACVVTVGVDLDYDSLLSASRVVATVANQSAPPLPAEFRIALDVTASLESFDERTLPGDGLTLTLD